MFLDQTGYAQPEIKTLPSLIAWLEQQPADQGYSYIHPYSCLIAQYLKAHGTAGDAVALGIPELIKLGFIDVVIGYPRTFGGALERARLAIRQGN